MSYDQFTADLITERDALRAEVERLREALKADTQTLKLHLGEMTAQETRTLKAGFAWVLSRAPLNTQEKT